MRSQVTKRKGVVLRIEILDIKELEALIQAFMNENANIHMYRTQKALEDARKEFV